MIQKDTATRVFEICLSTGGDFAEIYYEDTTQNTLEVTSNKVSNANTKNIYGAGIRILKGFQEVYGYTNEVSLAGLEKLATQLASSFNDKQSHFPKAFQEINKQNNHPVLTSPVGVKNQDKVSTLLRAYQVAKDEDPAISQVIVSWMDENQKMGVYNSDGVAMQDTRTHSRIFVVAVASKDGVMQQSSGNIGRHMGMELLNHFDIDALAKEVAQTAVTMLHAPEMVGQTMPVIIHNAFGGVIFHEACGHSLEATSVAKNLSVFSNKIGEQIASSIVTAIDDGTIQNAWGSLNYDDEGTPTQRNVLIEKGILKSYMVDTRNARRMNTHITGSARRQNYRFSPTSRMTNTFIAPGESTFDEIIASTPYALYAKKMGGGSVNPVTGEFNFAVSEGYMVENGKITHPVRGATLVGSGKEVLMKIDMIANNLDYGQGMCGSISGSIPTDVGQPTIRVSSMTVGGRGVKK